MAMMMPMKYDDDNHADEDEIVNLIAYFLFFLRSHCFPLVFICLRVDDDFSIFINVCCRHLWYTRNCLVVKSIKYSKYK